MRIIFMGTPEFAVPVLESLINSRHEVVASVTQPDRPKGRGKNMQFSPVKECALAHNIPVMQPVNVSVPEVIDELRAYEPELIVVEHLVSLLQRRFAKCQSMAASMCMHLCFQSIAVQVRFSGLL